MIDHHPRLSRPRRWITGLLLAAAALAGVMVLSTLVDGSVRWQVGGSRITNHSVARPAIVGIVALAVALAVCGWRRAVASVTTTRPRTLAALVAVATLAVGVAYASTSASGSDAYGYVGQADRWIEGELTIDQSWAAPAPWPMARWTFAPIGTRPSPVEPWLVSPMYPPGLPMLMAVGKLVGGEEGAFWIVPIAGALLVLATFGIGRKLATPWAGLIGAWLVATSPAFLFMLVGAMSDVPAAAACAVAFYFVLDRRPRAALAAGLAAGLAVAMRPNLAPCLAIFGLWYLVPFLRPGSDDRRATFVQGAIFAAGLAAGALVIAAFHNAVTGSPFVSTYGPMPGAFALDHFRPNLTRYVSRLVDSQTPVVLAGLIALALPLRALWPAATERLAFVVGGLFVVALWTMYCFYLVFDEWWYLRFLLPTWPFLMIGVGTVFAAVARRGRAAAAAVAVVVVVLGIHQVAIADGRFAFDLWKNERRYVTVAREVRKMTDRASAIFSMQHSSSIRYYGGRVSIRYDAMEAPWIDRSVDWLATRGIRSYLLVDDWEIPWLRERFAGRRIVERLDDAPLLHYQGRSQVYLFDLTGPRDPTIPTIDIVDTYENTRSVEPVSLPTLDLTPP